MSINPRTRARTSSERRWSCVRVIEAPMRKRASIMRMRNSASITSASDMTRVMLAAPRHPRIYGYIDLGSSQNLALADIERRIDAWQRAGGDGIFFDEAGSEFAVTPARRRAAVRAVHMRRLSAFLNAFVTDDLFQGDD